MVTMDAYEFRQDNNNNPGCSSSSGNNDQQYLSTDDDDELDRKDLILNLNQNYNLLGYGSMHQQQQQQQPFEPFYGSSPYNMMQDIKPPVQTFTDIPPLVPPMYLQTSSTYSYNDYPSYQGPCSSTSSSSSSNQFNQSYSYYKPWYNQVKSEQMANILNR